MSSLHSLPVELVLHIHLLALSPHLPTVSRHLHRLLSDEHNTSPLFRANWIQARLALEGIALAPAAAAAARSLATTSSTTSSPSSFASRSRRLRQYSSSAEASGQAFTSPTAAERGSKIPQFFTHALRFPICGMDVLCILEDRCVAKGNQDAQAQHAEQKKCLEEAMRLAPPSVPPLGSSRTGSGRLMTPDEILLRPPPGLGAASADTPPVVSLRTLLRPRAVDVPKRLFRHISASPGGADTAFSQACARRDIDMLRHVLDDLRGDPDSHKGYPLAKAVLSGDMQLIRLLLDAGAHPGTKECMSIMLAIDKKDLEIVRTLIERGYYSGRAWCTATAGLHLRGDAAPSCDEKGKGKGKGKGKKRKRSRQDADLVRQEQEESPGKKRKLDRGPDRVAVTPAMLEAAVRKKSEPLIQYFMDKGAVPNMKTLQMLQR